MQSIFFVKQFITYGAHCPVHWDAFLYRHKVLAPAAWIIERTVSTPSTHSAHHGKYAADTNTHYKGNYGNFFFFWDVLFGTAKITRVYPQNYGIENLSAVDWWRSVYWPFGNNVAYHSKKVAISDRDFR